MTPVLDIRDLSVGFAGHAGVTQVLDRVALRVTPGEIVGLAGESGSGKSTTPMAALGLLSGNAIVTGDCRFEGDALDLARPRTARQQLGGRASVVFQQPMKAFSPYLTFGRQLVDAISAQTGLSRKEARKTALAALDDVQMPDPEIALRKYPHQVSGGQAQRMMIALALSCQPRLLVADEPTTALDVTVQAQVVHLIRELAKKRNIGVLFITHDLGVVAELCDSVSILYAGRNCEATPVANLFDRPRHRYSAALMGSMPRIGGTEALKTITGNAPSAGSLPKGCAFHPRCLGATDECRESQPIEVIESGSRFACWHPLERHEVVS